VPLVAEEEVDARYGFTAPSTRASRAISTAPSAARHRNQTRVTGPKIEPTLAVPRYCTRKRAIRMTMVRILSKR
jgi:hypothetical protein